jgi:isopentenyl phosphate kinase
MLTFVKLGGSLITDKTVEEHFREDAMHRLASEIAAACRDKPDLQLIIGHGSGSFGHFAAKRHDTIHGVQSDEEWRGLAEVAMAAAKLNGLVAQSLVDAGLPIWRLQPSASAIAADGVLTSMVISPLHQAVKHGLIPLIYGDVSLDNVRGGTIISTETIFTYLAGRLPVTSIYLVGEVPGVLDQNGQVISRITPGTIDEISNVLGGSRGTDVTGGMLTKVSEMLALVKDNATLQIRIIDGTQPDVLRSALLGAKHGTLICSDAAE